MQTYKVIVDNDKNRFWYNEKNYLHRLDGPAVEYADGGKDWWVEGKRHRLDGPAIERTNGHKEWFVQGKCHRLDGPAFENASGYKEWWVEDKLMTEEEFNAYIKSKPTCEGKVIEVDGIKYKLTKA
jgi:hypothetical protein